MKNYCVSDRQAGRPMFTDDFLSIQETAKSILHLFDVCDKNFVIDGCGITLSADKATINIKSGYLYIDGDICHFNGWSGSVEPGKSITIKKVISEIKDIYNDGSNDIIYENITTSLSTSETDVDVLASAKDTKAVSAVSDGGTFYFPTISTAFFDKYCIVKSTPGASSGTVVVNQTIKANAYKFGNCAIEEGVDGEVVISTPSKIAGKPIKLIISPEGRITLSRDGEFEQMWLNIGKVNCFDVNTETMRTGRVDGIDDGDFIEIPYITSKEINAQKITSQTAEVVDLTAKEIQHPNDINTPVSFQAIATKTISATGQVSTPKIQHPNGEPVIIPSASIGQTYRFQYGSFDGMGTNEAFDITFTKLTDHIVTYCGRINFISNTNRTRSATSKGTAGTAFMELYDAIVANDDAKKALLPSNNVESNVFIQGVYHGSSADQPCTLSSVIAGLDVVGVGGMMTANYQTPSSGNSFVLFMCQGIYYV